MIDALWDRILWKHWFVPAAGTDRSTRCAADLGRRVHGTWPWVSDGLSEIDLFGPRRSFGGTVRTRLPVAAFSTFWLWMQHGRLPPLGAQPCFSLDAKSRCGHTKCFFSDQQTHNTKVLFKYHSFSRKFSLTQSDFSIKLWQSTSYRQGRCLGTIYEAFISSYLNKSPKIDLLFNILPPCLSFLSSFQWQPSPRIWSILPPLLFLLCVYTKQYPAGINLEVKVCFEN